jgi:hypothetical protein
MTAKSILFAEKLGNLSVEAIHALIRSNNIY